MPWLLHRLRWILVVVVGLALLALEPASAFPSGLELHGRSISSTSDSGPSGLR